MKKYILWICCFLLLCAVLAGCTGNPDIGEATNEPEVKIYWNVDREAYTITDEGFSTRVSADGVYRARFAVDGEQVDLFFDNPYLMAEADKFDFMGLAVNSENYVQEVLPVEQCSGGIAVLQYYVEAFDGKTMTCNVSGNFRGQRIKLQVNENTQVYNVGGEGLMIGLPGTIEVGQQVSAVMDYDGSLSHVFVKPPFEQKPVYWNVNRQYDSAKQITKRESDALGEYTILFAVDGQQVELKTRELKVVNSIDKFGAKCMHLEFDDQGYIKNALHPGKATGGTSKASWFHITELTNTGFVAEKFAAGKDQGTVIQLSMSADCKIFDVSGKGTMVGEPTDLRVNDQVHCLTNSFGDVCVIFIVGGRYMDLPYYWNIDRCYSSASKDTTRKCDSEGWYYLRMAHEGKQVTLRTNDKALVKTIDSRAARACVLAVEGDVIKEAYAPNVTANGQTFASWMTVTKIDKDGTVHAVKNDGTTDQAVMTADTKVYNVGELARFKGCTTDLRVGDQIHGLKHFAGTINIVYVINRPISSPIYWNVERMYNSKTKETTRVPDADGWYYITLAGNGKQEIFKTKDKSLMTEIDSISTRICGLSAYNGIITKVHAAKTVQGYTGGSKGGWCNIIAMDGTTVTVQKQITQDKDYGSIYKLEIPEKCPVYNCSTNVDGFVGEPATLKMGDRIHSLLDEKGKIVLVLIVDRPLEMEIYWNIVKYDLDGNGNTTRSKDADGGYSFLLCANGEQMTYKTYDQSIANYIDSRAARCTGMAIKDGKIVEAVVPTKVNKGLGGTFASWMNITAIDADGTIHATKSDGSTDSGKPIENCEIYDVSGTAAFAGIPTTVKVGDQIHGLKNADGQVSLIYVISRPRVAYCEACGKDVVWNEYDGTASGHRYLTKDVSNVDTRKIEAGATWCLDLNGHNIDGKSSALRIFNIYGTLNLMGEGTVTAHNPNTKMAPCFYVQDGGTFNMYGGDLTSQFSAPRAGVGIVQETFNMYGGRIYGGYATGNGGNLEIIAGKTKLLGGVIEGGKADGNGAGVYSTVNFTLGGDVQISDNTGTNIYLASDKKLTVQDDFTGTAGVSIANGTGVFTTAVAAGMESRIASDAGNKVVRNSDGTLSMVAPPHEHCVCDGTANHGGCTNVVWEPWTGTVKDGGHYYLTEDLKDVNVLKIEANTTVSICLNGHNIDGKSNTLRVFNIYGTLNLCGEGTITAHNAGTKLAPVFFVQPGGTFNMYGGNLTSEFSAPRGAVGLVQATMNMYGGRIYGGYATGNGGNIDLLAEGYLNLYGGVIEGGKADGYGSGVYALGMITVGGDVQITDGLCIGNSKLMTVKDDFTGKIVVSLKNETGVFTNAVKTGMESCFKAVSGKTVIRNADGKLEIVNE